MLTLSRKRGESLVFLVDERRVEIVVKSISPSKVSLAIAAPLDVSVIRSEIEGRLTDDTP